MPETPQCERFHAAASLQLDGELSRLEAALQRAHALRCGDCRAYAAELGRIAAHIRGSPLEAPRRQLAVPARPLRVARRAVTLAAALATLAVLAAGLGELRAGGEAESQPARPASVQSIEYERLLLRGLVRPGGAPGRTKVL